ncbi:MAG: site-specific integrase [Phycisphaerae bacterium]|nr:MAG: site-specific integrase [Phycisphaerae bacterium]
MGVIVKQKVKGRGNPWWVFLNHDGTRRTKRIGDRQAAEAVASALRKKLKAGEFNLVEDSSKSKSPKFPDYAAHYLESFAKTALKQNTWKGYESIIRLHISPAWKDKRLDAITRADVKRLILRKQKDGYSAKTIENIKALISGIFTHAYEDEILAVNPALKLGRFIPKQDRRKSVQALSREQAAEVIAAAKTRFPQHHTMILCAFRTGLRLGELLGLAWSDLDFEACTIEVRRSFSHGHWSLPKSNKSRTLDMSDQLRSALLQHREDLKLRFGATLPTVEVGSQKPALLQLVFPSWRGGPICGDNFRKRVFRKLIEAADVPEFRIHDIRHTFASLLLTQGESLHYVKEQMGHASIQTTVDVYGHMVPGSNRNAVNRLDDAAEPNLSVLKSSVA